MNAALEGSCRPSGPDATDRPTDGQAARGRSQLRPARLGEAFPALTPSLPPVRGDKSPGLGLGFPDLSTRVGETVGKSVPRSGRPQAQDCGRGLVHGRGGGTPPLVRLPRTGLLQRPSVLVIRGVKRSGWPATPLRLIGGSSPSERGGSSLLDLAATPSPKVNCGVHRQGRGGCGWTVRSAGLARSPLGLSYLQQVARAL
jgi:hypothetical protein